MGRASLEAVQAAEGAITSSPGPQPQVEGVAQDDLRAHLLERARQHALDRAVGAHRHEDRRLDDAVVQREAAAAGLALGGQQIEFEHAADCRRAQLTEDAPGVSGCAPAAWRRRS
jgi:hypothetical protein